MAKHVQIKRKPLVVLTKGKKKSGTVDHLKRNVAKKKSRLDDIMKDIKMLNKRGTK